MRNERMIDQRDFNAIKAVFIGLMAGENRMAGNHYHPSFEESGTKCFLDWLKQNRPEVFSNPELILELVYSLPRIDQVCALEDDSFLVELFRNYLAPELKENKDVLLAFLRVDPWGYENPYYRENGIVDLGIPRLLYGLPHELLMDEEVFSQIMEKTDPLSIASEILEEEELLDERYLFMFLKWYEKRFYGPAFIHKELEGSMFSLYYHWAEKLTEKGIYSTEEADEVYTGINPYVSDCFSLVIEDYTDYFSEQAKIDMETEHKRSLSLKLDQFMPVLRKRVLEETEWAKRVDNEFTEERVAAMEVFSWEESFRKLLKPFWTQLEMFDAALTGDFPALDLPEKKPAGDSNGGGEDGSSDGGAGGASDGGGFMNFPEVDADLPF